MAEGRDYLRIATEEACCPPEMLDIYRKLIDDKAVDDPGFLGMWGFYIAADTERTRFIRDHLIDVDDKRIAHMDAAGIDKAVLSLTAPGVQVMPKDTAVGFATFANDWLADAVKRHPTRYVGLAAAAPQDPAAAAREIERAVTKLGMRGVIMNSHTMGEYLDDPKFWPIFEAAEALDVPIYIHPNTPNRHMYPTLAEKGLDGAIFGFSVETGMHILRLIVAGVFDRFPRLQIVIGHVGESLPFTLYRIDYMHRASTLSGRYEAMKPLQKKPSDYMKSNLYYTNSGVAWAPPIRFIQDVIGVDRMMYAMDYPYQYLPAEVDAMDAMDMPAADKKAFFQTNAERLFRI